MNQIGRRYLAPVFSRLHNDLEVGNHHCHPAEQRLQILRELLPACITRVHRDEEAADGLKEDVLRVARELEVLHARLLGVLDRQDLPEGDAALRSATIMALFKHVGTAPLTTHTHIHVYIHTCICTKPLVSGQVYQSSIIPGLTQPIRRQTRVGNVKFARSIFPTLPLALNYWLHCQLSCICHTYIIRGRLECLRHKSVEPHYVFNWQLVPSQTKKWRSYGQKRGENT